MIELYLYRLGSLGHYGLFTLKHGQNFVRKVDWEEAKKGHAVQAYLKMGKKMGIEVVGESSKSAPNSDGKLSAKETIELVSESDLGELEELKEGEDRSTVLDAIQKRGLFLKEESEKVDNNAE